MLRSFFEIGTDKSLFDGLYISQNKSLCDEQDVYKRQLLHIFLNQDRDTYMLLPISNIQIRRSEEHTSELQSLMRISYAAADLPSVSFLV